MKYDKKPRCFLLKKDVDFFGETIPGGTIFYNLNDLDHFIPCFKEVSGPPVLDFSKSINYRNVISNDCFFEIPLIKEYLSVLNNFYES